MAKPRENKILHKARIRQTRWFALLILPLILFNDTSTYNELGRLLIGWMGLFCLIVCAFGRVFASVFIGGRKNELVVRDGLFSVVRNPLYVFSFFGTVGLGLLCHSLLITALLAGIYIAYYRMVVRKEEQFLTRKFGDDYLAYTREVPRWIPKLSQWRTAEVIETRPAFILKTLCDASAFFLIIPLAQLLAWLHVTGMLPVYFRLP